MIRAAAETTEKLMAEKDSPVLGLHLEGHYFNMKMAGGQIPENIKNPDPEEYIPLLEETHCIKRWDAAPELPGAMQFGKYITPCRASINAASISMRERWKVSIYSMI